jgi:hypothetical protein
MCDPSDTLKLLTFIRQWNLLCLRGILENKKAHMEKKISDDDFEVMRDFWIGMVVSV